jgi:hypothetical protein
MAPSLQHPQSKARSAPKGRPDERKLIAVLGPSKPYWDRLVSKLDEVGGVSREWKDDGRTRGWQLKALRNQRALLYLITHEGHFTASFPLKGAAYEAVCASELPASFLRELKRAKEYPEGRPARVAVLDETSARLAEQLLSVVLGR